MLACIDSPELAEWMAFERAFGPISNEWRDETLAELHEQLQLLIYITGAQYEDNPAPAPRPHPRPPDLLADDGDDDSQD